MNIVTAQHLELWSNSLAARADLPGVIASLIRASCSSLETYRFPNGDASQTHGFDGVAEVVEGKLFVPAGRSVWEFGTGKSYASKAEDDYAKRTAASSPEERARQSFIFVTSRKWDSGLDEWEREHSNDGWLKVRILDCISLEHWLGEYPAVALPLARELGIIPPSGISTVPDFWDEYRLNFAPALTSEMLLNGRKDRAKRLCDALTAGLPNMSKWQAGSPTEATAFIAAAIISAEPETSRFLLSKTLILETADVAQIVPRENGFIFILPPTAARLGPALARANQVVITLGDDNLTGDAETLERMNTIEFSSGLKTMGIEDEEAYRLASICGRSLTVLSRLKASTVSMRPRWHDDRALVPLVLAGGWDATNKHDCDLVADLCNTPYDKVDSEARRLASQSDAPLDLENSIWTLRSPMDAFILVGSLIDSGCQKRLHEACQKVFSENDQTLDAAETGEIKIQIRGADFRHSEWLRRGLARTLLLISGLHEAARFRVIGLTSEQYVDGIVGSIPRLSEDARVLASLKSELPRLSEAAPRPLASALERVLEGDSWVSVIFRDSEDRTLWGSSSPHTYILWALETMAWSPSYLHRAASILMTLADRDPGGRLSNRPLRSLREIFLAWRPNTYASLDERIAVLRSVCRDRSSVGLQLALSLLPVVHDFSGGTAKPRLRDFGESSSTKLTDAEVRSAFREYAEVAVELAGTDISRLTSLVSSLPQLDVLVRSRVLAAIRSAATDVDSDEVFQLWSKLRDLVQNHRYFQDANWALKTDQLEPLEQLCKAIEPTDPVRQVLWLFDDYVPRVHPPKGSDYLGDANADRVEALRILLRDHGLPAVLALVKTAKLPHTVGIALAGAAPSLGILKDATTSALAPGFGVNTEFVIALSAVASGMYGSPWDNWIGDLAKTLDPGSAADLFLRWEDARRTWDFVGTLSTEIEREYWTRKQAFRPASSEDFQFAFDKYAQLERFSAILDMVGYQEKLLSTSQCISVLGGLVGEVAKSPWKLQRIQYEIVHMIRELQQREDVDLQALGALEYQYLPILEFQAEPIALNRLLGTSPALFVDVICDAYSPASGATGEITDERRLRARLAYKLLQSMKRHPSVAASTRDVNDLRAWVVEVRVRAREADREIITDQQIGQILAYAPTDIDDGGWPPKPMRDLIEELSAPQIETGIAVCRFNQRGTFSKSLYDGGRQERALAEQYRNWSETARRWPRTSALLRQIAEDWDRHAARADSEAELDQLRDT